MTDTNIAESERLAFYIPNLTTGGAEQVTVNIANGLSERGYDIDLVVSHPGGALRTEVADKVSVTHLAESRVPGLGVGAHLPKLVRYLEDTEPRLLISQKTDANVVCLGAERLAHSTTTVVPTEHIAFSELPNESMKATAVRKLATRLYQGADGLIAVSEGVARSVTQRTVLDRDDVSVLHNPVEIGEIRRLAREPVAHDWVEDDAIDVVLFVGRHHPQKDLETWLRVFNRVYEDRPETRGVIAGQGEETEALRELTGELGLTDVVSIPGYVENPYRFMNQASLFLLSSKFEGLPTVLIEALACGCPVVATDCPCGPREILAGGEYGTLAAVQDVEQIASAVTDMLDDPVPGRKLEERATDFAPETVLRDYEQFIEARLS